MTHTNLFDRRNPLLWPRRGHERAGRDAAGGHTCELVDEGNAEAEEDAPRPRGLQWQGSAADTWGGGGGTGAKRSRARPFQSDEEEVRACREGGHGDDGQTRRRLGGERDAMCYGWGRAREGVVAPRASQRIGISFLLPFGCYLLPCGHVAMWVLFCLLEPFQFPNIFP